MVLERLEHPIIQAPLGGGPSTPGLTAAVSEAGGLGFLAAGYRDADAVAGQIAEVRQATERPFGVNLFAPTADRADPAAVRSYVQSLSGEAERYGVAPGAPRHDDDGWEAKLRLLCDRSVAVVSVTFGCPPAEAVASLKAAGSEVWITVTGLEEARLATAAGADALIAQGVEAGGHRASFAEGDGSEGLSTLVLVRLLARAEPGLALVAAGGVGDGAGVAALLAAGARAVALGTAFMRCPEAATHPAQRALLGSAAPTALTRAFSGRWARGLVNRFMREHGDAPEAYPQIHHATSPLRAAARERGDTDGFNLWAGQGHPLTQELPAGRLVEELGGQAREALAAASARVGGA